ncbi:MAG: dockerin type I repeat-containing protein [Bacteroidales bacterium]|nr:dockerin type I repeat-containing protein [Bacteroidales bacterium]
MRKLFVLIIISMAAMTMNANDRLYINDFNINAGESKTIEVLLSNDTAYCALQTDIVLPQGLSIAVDDDEYIVDLTNRKGRDHVVSTNMLGDGSIRVFVSSQGSNSFSGNSGAILTIEITASSSFTKGNVIIKNSVLVEEDGTRHQLANEIAKVNGGIPIFIPGDVNGDGECTGSDVTALYNYILYNDTSAIVNGDQNGDNQITGSDVTAVYNIILGI